MSTTHVQQQNRHLARAPALFIGCAGWTIPAAHADRFPAGSSHLQRYAQAFNCVEINSSFYRSHLPATYARWAATVPEDFRFAVKMPRTISHQAQLHECGPALQAFLAQVGPLDTKLGCLLLQLPPSLAYVPSVALPFFDQLRRLYQGPVVCEPRHASWFDMSVNHSLVECDIVRVAADPVRVQRAAVPAGNPEVQYLRLHGSPRTYYDSYSETCLRRISTRLHRFSRQTSQRWCIFDNTALGHATANALTLAAHMRAVSHG